jgi:two-component system response regulator AtoC
MAALLLVEDERLLRWALRKRLEGAGYVVDEASTLNEAEMHLLRRRPDVVLLDVNLPDGSGIDFLSTQHEKLSESSVFVMTAEGNIEDAVRAMKLGATDFLSKPVDQEELLRLIQRATAMRRQVLEAEGSRRARENQSRIGIVAESQAMKDVLRLAATVAAHGTTTVLIQGETGVGKEVIARYIHANSPRASAPMQALNCAALPEHLVESELFGYEKGAFTDAKTSRKGLFELADGGTVVLDEIGEIPLPLQAKLLRFLEERTFRRLGGVREMPVDVRVLAMTNRSLRQQVANGNYREDLFYRLNVFPITVPPLRQRREDIIPLALDFLNQFGAPTGKKFTDVEAALRQRLVDHVWTGNVRELRNLMERAAIMEPAGILQHVDLLPAEPSNPRVGIPETEIVHLEEIEFVMVQRAVRRANGNQSQAARLLGVTRDQLRYRVKQYREAGRWAEE